jgi:2-methylcitrate dehydratase
VTVEYPIGHRRRRDEELPLLGRKFAANIVTRLPPRRCDTMLALWRDPPALAALCVPELMGLLEP